jgi:hypothetical protein
MSVWNGLLIKVIKRKAKYRFHTAAMLPLPVAGN